jgi:hypothetical protein
LGKDFGEAQSPSVYMKTCAGEKIKEAVVKMESQGGTMTPTLFKRFLFEEEKNPYDISYLCYSSEPYAPCVNQKPMLISDMEKEMQDYLEKEEIIEGCLSSLKKSYEKAGYEADISKGNFKIMMQNDKIAVEINSEIKLTKGEESSSQKGIVFFTESKIYNLAVVCVEIINERARTCNFDSLSFALNNPDFEIDKYKDDDRTEIYTITEKKNGEKFRFAVRGGCTKI